MHPFLHAQSHPDRAAYIMAGTGETVTYKQLDERSLTEEEEQIIQQRVRR